MEKQFEIGDVVRLKSGGPQMTIGVIERIGICDNRAFDCECSWFVDCRNKSATFDSKMLEYATP